MSTLLGYGRRLAQHGRQLPPIVVDAVIASGCYLSIVVMGVLDGRTEWWMFVLAAANTLPLLWRRRFPFTVTAVTGAFTTWLAIVGTLGNIPAAQLVATYTFAALCPPVLRLAAAAGTVVGVTISILVPKDNVLSFTTAGIMFIVAYALGTGARARRDRIAMLEERARRFAEEQAAAATRERERIAREMHDILAHSMSLVVVQAEAGPVVVRSDPAKAEQAFDAISAAARDALTQLRRVLGVLRADQPGEPARVPQPDLTALPPLVDSVREAGLTATLEQHGEPRPIPADLAATAYRIVQESLTNTLKHAGASTVRVQMEWRDGALQLEVRDDGRGPVGNGPAKSVASCPAPEPASISVARSARLRFGPGQGAPAGGRGLVGMRERVAAAGGELTTGAGPDGAGFRVWASLPLQ